MSLKSIFLTYSLLLSSQLDFFTFFQTKVLRSIAGKRKISKMLFFVCVFLEQVYFYKRLMGLIQDSFVSYLLVEARVNVISLMPISRIICLTTTAVSR